MNNQVASDIWQKAARLLCGRPDVIVVWGQPRILEAAACFSWLTPADCIVIHPKYVNRGETLLCLLAHECGHGRGEPGGPRVEMGIDEYLTLAPCSRPEIVEDAHRNSPAEAKADAFAYAVLARLRSICPSYFAAEVRLEALAEHIENNPNFFDDLEVYCE